MDALECLRTRRSIRTYSSAPVSRDDIEAIVDCARVAPTAMNRQPWMFVAIESPATRARIVELTGHAAFLTQAPVCVAVFCREGDFWVEDGSAATENLLLAAHARGLGSCWVACHPLDYAAPIATLLHAPAEYRLLALVALGYAAEQPQPEKRPLRDVLKWETF